LIDKPLTVNYFAVFNYCRSRIAHLWEEYKEHQSDVKVRISKVSVNPYFYIVNVIEGFVNTLIDYKNGLFAKSESTWPNSEIYLG